MALLFCSKLAQLFEVVHGSGQVDMIEQAIPFFKRRKPNPSKIEFALVCKQVARDDSPLRWCLVRESDRRSAPGEFVLVWPGVVSSPVALSAEGCRVELYGDFSIAHLFHRESRVTIFPDPWSLANSCPDSHGIETK